MKTSKIYFISGHGNVSFEEWLEYYKPQIDNALLENAKFIISDFRGADVISMEYLKNKTKQVTVYHCFEKPRYKVDVVDLQSKDWEYIGGYSSDSERDKDMTNCSTDDILWIKAGKEKSGTAKNLKRRNLLANENNQNT